MIYVRRLMDRNLEGAIDSEEVRPAEI